MLADPGCTLVPKVNIFNDSGDHGHFGILIGTAGKWLQKYDQDHMEFCSQHVYMIGLFKKYLNLR